jgi:hypothetical protein
MASAKKILQFFLTDVFPRQRDFPLWVVKNSLKITSRALRLGNFLNGYFCLKPQVVKETSVGG